MALQHGERNKSDFRLLEVQEVRSFPSLMRNRSHYSSGSIVIREGTLLVRSGQIVGDIYKWTKVRVQLNERCEFSAQNVSISMAGKVSHVKYQDEFPGVCGPVLTVTINSSTGEYKLFLRSSFNLSRIKEWYQSFLLAKSISQKDTIISQYEAKVETLKQSHAQEEELRRELQVKYSLLLDRCEKVEKERQEMKAGAFTLEEMNDIVADKTRELNSRIRELTAFNEHLETYLMTLTNGNLMQAQPPASRPLSTHSAMELGASYMPYEELWSRYMDLKSANLQIQAMYSHDVAASKRLDPDFKRHSVVEEDPARDRFVPLNRVSSGSALRPRLPLRPRTPPPIINRPHSPPARAFSPGPGPRKGKSLLNPN